LVHDGLQRVTVTCASGCGSVFGARSMREGTRRVLACGGRAARGLWAGSSNRSARIRVLGRSADDRIADHEHERRGADH